MFDGVGRPGQEVKLQVQPLGGRGKGVQARRVEHPDAGEADRRGEKVGRQLAKLEFERAGLEACRVRERRKRKRRPGQGDWARGRQLAQAVQ